MINFDQLRALVAQREIWSHVHKVIDIIEEKANADSEYKKTVDYWLNGDGSTVWLRDEVMEPIRKHPEIVAIGKQFNPSTQWHNTWMPLDTLIYNVKMGWDLL